jgi:outer membrane protein OmpA-like peptidoglycan-associated protein
VNINILIEGYTGSTADSRKRLKLAEGRNNAIITVLTQDYKIPRDKIRTEIHKSTRLEAPAVKITVHQPEE